VACAKDSGGKIVAALLAACGQGLANLTMEPGDSILTHFVSCQPGRPKKRFIDAAVSETANACMGYHYWLM
jgi:hypothetical protein